MPRDGIGVYSPPPSSTAVPNTKILSSAHNALVADLTADANAARPISAGGTGATNAADARAALGIEGALQALISDPWALQPIGVPIPVFDHIDDLAPPTDLAYRYINLSAGLTDAGEYNEGLLTGESVSGSAPAVQATAVIDDDDSPLDGKTIRLINTERRFLRAGSSGTVEADALASHPHTASFAGNPVPNHTHTFLGDQFDSDDNSGTGYGGAPTTRSTDPAGGHTPSGTVTVNAAGDTETRGKNIGVSYYMRIK